MLWVKCASYVIFEKYSTKCRIIRMKHSSLNQGHHPFSDRYRDSTLGMNRHSGWGAQCPKRYTQALSGLHPHLCPAAGTGASPTEQAGSAVELSDTATSASLLQTEFNYCIIGLWY